MSDVKGGTAGAEGDPGQEGRPGARRRDCTLSGVVGRREGREEFLVER